MKDTTAMNELASSSGGGGEGESLDLHKDPRFSCDCGQYVSITYQGLHWFPAGHGEDMGECAARHSVDSRDVPRTLADTSATLQAVLDGKRLSNAEILGALTRISEAANIASRLQPMKGNAISKEEASALWNALHAQNSGIEDTIEEEGIDGVGVLALCESREVLKRLMVRLAPSSVSDHADFLRSWPPYAAGRGSKNVPDIPQPCMKCTRWVTSVTPCRRCGDTGIDPVCAESLGTQ